MNLEEVKVIPCFRYRTEVPQRHVVKRIQKPDRAPKEVKRCTADAGTRVFPLFHRR